MKHLRKQIEVIAKEAGEMILQREQLCIEDKGDVANLVTSMDVKVQEFIVRELQSLIPEAKFIAEENSVFDYGDEYVWIIDPIDGTTNYAYDMKFSAISIALIHQNEGKIGVVYNPYLKEMFVGVRNEGSYLNEKSIHVSNFALHETLTAFGTSPYRKELAAKTFANVETLFTQGRDVRRSGSAVLDMCNVACARVDAFYEESLSPWDYAAASIIIEEAGGVLSTIGNTPWSYDKVVGLIAGNKENINSLKNIIK